MRGNSTYSVLSNAAAFQESRPSIFSKIFRIQVFFFSYFGSAFLNTLNYLRFSILTVAR